MVRMMVVAVYAAELDTSAIHGHNAFFYLHFSEANLLLDLVEGVRSGIQTDPERVEIGRFGSPFSRVLHRDTDVNLVILAHCSGGGLDNVSAMLGKIRESELQRAFLSSLYIDRDVQFRIFITVIQICADEPVLDPVLDGNRDEVDVSEDA